MRYQIVIEVEAETLGEAIIQAFDDPGPISVREEAIFSSHGAAGQVGWQEVLIIEPQ